MEQSLAEKLKNAVNVISQPPFEKPGLSAIEIHDELPLPSLLQLITDIMAAIDSGNPFSQHKSVSIRNEDPENTVLRMGDFCRVLRFSPATDIEAFRNRILQGERQILLEIFVFLLLDVETHIKRAYLFRFLGGSQVPRQFEHDEEILTLLNQVKDLQEEFKEIHKMTDLARQSGNECQKVKKEIQMMEEEKTQVSSNLFRLKTKVESLPSHQQWMDVARKLRLEQMNETKISERIFDQKRQLSSVENKLQSAQQSLKEAQGIISSGNPESLLSKMKEDSQANKYLCNEKLPMTIKELKKQSESLTYIIKSTFNNASRMNIKELEEELKAINEVVAKLSEEKLLKNSSGDAKLALFRQQSDIIKRKKEGAAVKLADAQEILSKAELELSSKRNSENSMQNNADTNKNQYQIPKGEELKKYVNDLRVKSLTYKNTKRELAALATELGVLQRTEDILKTKESGLRKKIRNLEDKKGVLGFHETQETLEKISEEKAQVDQAKGETLGQVTDIVNQLLETINSKKSSLAPVIQELRQLRQEHSDLETKFNEEHQIYSNALAGVQTEAISLEREVSGYRSDLAADQSRFAQLQLLIKQLELEQDRILDEMKAYVGGNNDTLDQLQISRGFKTYRDLYSKRILEAEAQTRTLKESQKSVKASHDSRMNQLKEFQNLFEFMKIKVLVNNGLLEKASAALAAESGPNTQRGNRPSIRPASDSGYVQQDRLVL